MRCQGPFRGKPEPRPSLQRTFSFGFAFRETDRVERRRESGEPETSRKDFFAKKGQPAQEVRGKLFATIIVLPSPGAGELAARGLLYLFLGYTVPRLRRHRGLAAGRLEARPVPSWPPPARSALSGGTAARFPPGFVCRTHVPREAARGPAGPKVGAALLPGPAFRSRRESALPLCGRRSISVRPSATACFALRRLSDPISNSKSPDSSVTLSLRQALLVAFALPVLLVSGILLTVSLVGTAQMTRDLADPLMLAMSRETGARLHRVFDPINQQVVEDYVALRQGRFSIDDPEALKNRLMGGLYAIPQVDSLMLGDQTGSQFLVMRYGEAAYGSPLLASVVASLPRPDRDPHRLQFFTRDFRPALWGENSKWSLWGDGGRTLLRQWELPLKDYDSRQRPWHRAAMAAFRDMSLDDARALGADLVSWTDVYSLFTTHAPSISAAVAARDPAGRIRIVAYDLLLDEIAGFSSSTRPTARGALFVMTDGGQMIGPPCDAAPGADERRAAAILKPVAATGYRNVAEAVAHWRDRLDRRAGHFRVELGGEMWWASFSPFEIGAKHRLWIGVLLPESDLIPTMRHNQWTIILVGAAMLLGAAGAAAWMARAFSAPLTALAAQSRLIADLNLADQPLVRSPFAELTMLSRMLHDMRQSLRQRIAERENAREELHRSEQQVRMLAENSPDVIVRYDRNGRHLYVNPAFARVTGLSRADALSREIHELGYAPDLLARWEGALAQVFTANAPVTLEFEYSSPAGSRHFESRVIPETNSTGRVDSALVVSRDITDRVDAAAALQRSEMRYRTLIESALVGIAVHQNGLIRYANRAALQIFGYESLDQVAPQIGWQANIEPFYHRELQARIVAAMRGETVPAHPGWRLIRNDGARRWVQSSVTLIEWDGGDAVLSFFRDITDLREATDRQGALEEQLRQAQKLEAVGLLAGGIAHDFNNVLQIVGGNASLALDADLPSEERLTTIREILAAAQRAGQMTRQLLAFSRRQVLLREDVELNTFVAEHLNLVRRLFPENIRIEFSPASRPLVVSGDRGQLEQVLLNLCVNARDAMPAGGRLTVRLEPVALDTSAALHLGIQATGPFARLSISDTGHGMDKATLERIFEPFFSTKPRDKGTGLGLAVVYGIVRQHDGRIEARSEPGQGTQFVVHLPHHPERQAAVVAPPPAHRRSRAEGTILLAEDEVAVREVAVQMLKRNGYKVISVPNGEAAIAHFGEHRATIDLLFFDVMMPGLGGFAAAAQCRLLKPEIPVLFASGYAAGALAEQPELPAGTRILQKPYRVEDLLQAVQRLLNC